MVYYTRIIISFFLACLKYGKSIQMEGIPAPPSWTTTWQPCNPTPLTQHANKIVIINSTASPGSFAGRTGHSGAAKIFANITTRVDGGTVYRQASRDGNQGSRESLDLCDWLENGCPLEEGNEVRLLSKRSKVPWYAPEGSYIYTYRANDKRKKLLFCIQVTGLSNV
mmetsp:Transcript_14072/g.19372  ORF Transcript_14072/g.19372 Transcript_14072/m.19372 type:complete len:167 (+) Transcript_14072:38-538(+)